ncbi:uncharacterized protein LOC132196997 isoform X2 [Neocloeon triangulifer]|uniref:uncharacterized protein LOC132196997 isoform X2 n=1 Tax=Neocloeon triangulifer TaxID=2078957 RepID=UPI00286EEC01|nr:uncharacterized protein LOC132196997 isoform X2 [Neocloeon triangulifer]
MDQGLSPCPQGALCIKDVSIQVPPTVSVGTDVYLRCLYDLEGDNLYMLKWYCGKEEFYRFVPKELPPTRVFPLPGFNVDMDKSDTHLVVLRSVTLEMSGRYRCEVSADAPTFHTAMVARWMHVVEFPEGRPELNPEKKRYAVGEVLRANCTSTPSTPPANVTWWLNGQRVNESWAKAFTPDKKVIPNEPSDSKSAPPLLRDESKAPAFPRGAVRSHLEVELGLSSFRDGKLHLRCEANLFGAARDAAEVQLDEERPRLASVLGTRESHPSPPSPPVAAASRGATLQSSALTLLFLMAGPRVLRLQS